MSNTKNMYILFNMNIKISLLITTLAALTTTLGIIPCFFKIKKQDNLIANILAFASGVMITISLISLIPEATNLLNEKYKPFPSHIICTIFIVIGILLTTLIDNKTEKHKKDSLYKLGIMASLALMLHNIPEGITTFITSSLNQELGYKLALAITLHNIPEGLSIAIPIYYSTKSKLKAFKYTFISGFSETFGAIIAYIFLKDIITPQLLSIILAITAGIMIDISIYEFLPTSYKYKKNKVTFIYFVLGIILMFFIELAI